MATEYTRVYKYRKDNISQYTESGNVSIPSTRPWEISGATTNKIGQITKITCSMTFTTGFAGVGNMTAHAELEYNGGSVKSSSCTMHPDLAQRFTFNWTGLNLSESNISSWTLNIVPESGVPDTSKRLYWKATNEWPVVLEFKFYDWNDMIGNSADPALTSTGITVNGAISGLYLRGQSNISITVKATIDSKYAENLVNNYSLTLIQSGKQIYSGSQTVKGAGVATFNVGTIASYGSVTINARMTDNVNRTVSATKTFTVTEYTGSTITGVSGKKLVERCKKVTDEFGSGESYVASSDGTIALLNVGAKVYNAGSKANTGTLSVTYGTGKTPGTGQTGNVTLGTATDGYQLSLVGNHTKITATFSPAQDYWFRFKLTDAFGLEITRDEFFDKAETVFNIEPYGVAVGQLSTGTSASKKFECAYPATFSGGVTFSGGNTTFSGSTTFSSGITDSKGYRMDYVGKTERLTITASGLAPYSQDRQPMLSRVGPIVFLEGALKATAAMNLQDDLKLCTLPTWARPRVIVSHLGQGSGAFLFWIRIESTGAVTLSRYRNGSSYGSLAVGNQLVFTLCWLAADAAPVLPTYSGDPAGEIPGIE